MRPGSVETSMGEVAPDGRLDDGDADGVDPADGVEPGLAVDPGDGIELAVGIDDGDGIEVDGVAPDVDGADEVDGIDGAEGVDGADGVEGVEAVDETAVAGGRTGVGPGLAQAVASSAIARIRTGRGFLRMVADVAIQAVTPLWLCRFREKSTADWDLWVGVVQGGRAASCG
jgi:hypothetical protein